MKGMFSERLPSRVPLRIRLRTVLGFTFSKAAASGTESQISSGIFEDGAEDWFEGSDIADGIFIIFLLSLYNLYAINSMM